MNLIRDILVLERIFYNILLNGQGVNRFYMQKVLWINLFIKELNGFLYCRISYFNMLINIHCESFREEDIICVF